jgi:hypothetical protein
MPSVLQFRRGTTTQNNAFTGALGELTVDVTLDTLVVHDGSTAGGHTLVSDTATQTLTNKTLTAPALTAPVITAITKSGSNGTGDIGQSDNKFATIYGLSSSAKYADVAEIYTTDQKYDYGTVIVIGGEKEVTQSTSANDHKVIGVVSENPALMMNSDHEGQFVALLGRVPCKVVGKVGAGDLLVTSSTPGHACACDPDVTRCPGTVIGKALEEKDSLLTGTIEVLINNN